MAKLSTLQTNELTHDGMPSSPDKKTQKEKRSVSFSKKKQLRKIPSLASLPESVIADCWFFVDDFDLMRKEYEYLLFFMDRCDTELIDEVVNEESDSTRGLEYKTEEGKWKRYENRRYAYEAVLNEQERQWREGKDNPSVISQLYQESSKKCIDIALEKAREDEIAVREYLQDKPTPSCAEQEIFLDGGSDQSGQRCSPPKKRRTATASPLNEICRNDNSSVCGDANGFTGQKWKPVPKGQRKSLLDVWKTEDVLVPKSKARV